MADMGPIGRFVYQTGMSAVVDSTINGVLGGGSGVLTGLSAMVDGVREAKENGYDDTRAMTQGIIAGILENATEKMGFERIANMLKRENGRTLSRVLREVASHMASEAMEEGSTTMLNQLADSLYGALTGQESEFTRLRDLHMEEDNMDEQQATARALSDLTQNIVLDAAGGALGGLMMGGGSMALSKAFNAAAEYQYKRSQNQSDTQANAQTSAQTDVNQTESAQEQSAQEQAVQERIAALAQETADEELGEQRAVQQRAAVQSAQASAQSTQASTQTENRVRMTGGEQAAVRNAARVYGKDASSFESHYTGGDVNQYRKAFDQVYQAGKVNLSLEQVNQTGSELVRGLSDQAKLEIWQAGRNNALNTTVAGVNRQYTQAMNSEQRAQVRLLDAIGKKYGIQIDVVDSLDYGSTRANAATVGKNHIVVAADAMEHAYVQAGVHELVHVLKNSNDDAYYLVADLVYDTLERTGVDMEKEIANRIEEYAQQGVKLNQEGALEEIVAESVPVVLSDREAMKTFVRDNRTVAEKIRDFFVEFAKTIEELAEKYFWKTDRTEVAAMMLADTQELTQIAEALDYALSAVAEENAQQAAEENAAAQAQQEAYSLGSKKWGLSKQELAMFYDKIGEIKIGKSAQFPKSSTGEFILAIKNKLVYTDGAWRNPQIVCVIELKVGNETMTDLARQFIFDSEKEGMTLAELRAVVESGFGEKTIRIDASRDWEASRWEERRGKEQNLHRAGEGNRGDLSAEGETRFSLKSPVEETDTLVAVHNLNAYKLEKALNLGGLPMPSIAVTKAEIGHSGFGDISLVFGRETVDPKADRANKVYSADAWTPTVPRTEYEADKNAAKRIRDRLNSLRSQMDDMFRADLNQLYYDLSDAMTRYGGEKGLVQEAQTNYGLKAAYLEEQGKHVSPVTKQKAVEKGYDQSKKSRYDVLLDALGTRDADELASTPVIDLYMQHKDELEQAMPGVAKSTLRFNNMLRGAIAYLRDTGAETEYRTVTDSAATRRAIDETINQQAYEQWVKELFSGVEGASGVYNNKERYTPNGNLRSFAATHFPATVEGIAQAMKSQNGGNAKNAVTGHGVKSLRAATAVTFSSVEAMHRRENRLGAQTQEEVDAQTQALDKRLMGLIGRIIQTKETGGDGSFQDYDLVEAAITEEAEKKYTAAGIRRKLEEYGYAANEELAGEVKSLLDEIRDMSVALFEAKPQRAIYFDEAKAAIVPDSLDSELLTRLREVVPDVLTYPDGDESARLKALNSLNDVKFSLVNTSKVENTLNQDKNLALPEDVKIDTKAVQLYAKDAMRAAKNSQGKINQQVKMVAGKILKETASRYKRSDLESNLRAVIAEYAKNGPSAEITQQVAAMSKAIIEGNEHLDNTIREQYADLRERMRKVGAFCGAFSLSKTTPQVFCPKRPFFLDKTAKACYNDGYAGRCMFIDIRRTEVQTYEELYIPLWQRRGDAPVGRKAGDGRAARQLRAAD